MRKSDKCVLCLYCKPWINSLVSFDRTLAKGPFLSLSSADCAVPAPTPEKHHIALMASTISYPPLHSCKTYHLVCCLSKVTAWELVLFPFFFVFPAGNRGHCAKGCQCETCYFSWRNAVGRGHEKKIYWWWWSSFRNTIRYCDTCQWGKWILSSPRLTGLAGPTLCQRGNLPNFEDLTALLRSKQFPSVIN